MEILLQIAVLLAFLRFVCRATFFHSKWGVAVFALLVALVSFISYPLVIEQSGDFYKTLLADRVLVGNVAVVLTLEAIAGMLLSIGLLNTLFVKKKGKLYLLKYLPEVLILGAVLYAEQQLFYAFPGYDFRLTASLIAGGLALLVGGGIFFIRWALPDLGGRYELNFLINVFLLVIAILMNAGLSSYNTASYQSEIEWQSTLSFLGLILLFVTIGWLLFQFKLKNKKLK